MPLDAGMRRTADPVELQRQRDVGQQLLGEAAGYGLATLAGLVAWVFLFRRIPFQFALALLGMVAVPAGRAWHRWWQWRQTQPGGEWMHPDKLQEVQQQAVKAMADAAKTRAWLTRGLIACIAVPSAFELFVGVEHAVRVASVEPRAVFDDGQWWRLLGGTYLHGSFYHFMGNMGALLVYGSILETKTARLRLPLVYLMSALGGSVLSAVMPPDIPSVGASGGIVGVIGYLYLFSRRQDVKFPPAFRGATASIFIGLITAGALGFWYIDNPGHAGGALTGLLLAGLIVDRARSWGEELPLPFLDLLGWLASAVLIAGAIVTCMAMLPQ
jgi:membrane associated rhomboid family serine protease